MAKPPKLVDQSSSTPSDYPQSTPRDLHPTSDIRFVMVEVGKLTASVDRLIADVKSQGEKVDAIRHQVTFIKGAMWTIGALIAVLTLLAKWPEIARLFQAAPP